MGFQSRADQISHTLLTTLHRCNLEVWAPGTSQRVGHRSLVTHEGELSEYNEDLIFLIGILETVRFYTLLHTL